MEDITLKDLKDFENNFNKDEILKNTRRAVTKNGVFASCIDDEVLRGAVHKFSIEVDSGDVTNQKQSGRCWMFAGLNVLRGIAIKKLGVKNIEFSQAYLQFYDKLEKANSFLDKAIELRDEEITSPLNRLNFSLASADGGYWSYFVNLVKKYGIVPKDNMPETAVSEATHELNTVLGALLNKDAMIIRDKSEKGITKGGLLKLKKNMLKEVYQLLACSLGLPPKKVVLEYSPKKETEGHLIRKEYDSPLDFYNSLIGEDLDSYISISNAQLPGFEQGKAYYSPWLDNITGAGHEIYFEVPLQVMKKSLIKSLKNGELAWFASDVSAQSLRKVGVLFNDTFKFDDTFKIDTKMKKGMRLYYYSSYSNHAMTFTGVNLVNGRPNRWKVENSWGKENGEAGYFVMDDDWFDNYVYQVIIKKDYLPEETVKAYEEAIKEPVETEPFYTIFASLD